MKFLHKIANIYAEKLTPTAQLLFVFPNRRAGLFFKRELLSLMPNVTFAPQITDINSLAANISPLRKANEIELLFTLYNSYSHIRSNHTDNIESIDSFIPFGLTLLGDFNEIDKYLIDTKLLFSNISDLKNINDQSQFLSKQQLETLKTFWNNVYSAQIETLSFNKQFISLWDDLYDIYTHFTQTLIDKGIGYDGLIYRTAIETLNKTEEENNPLFKTICFVGFNHLTPSEYKIFKHFQQLGIADFYFDYPQQYNSPSPLANSVSKYQKRNLQEFPSKFEYHQPQEYHTPNIYLHSTPSSSNQINIVCSLLHNDLQESTAILLTDESQMPSLIQQLPNNIDKINITMGYPLSSTPIATLINHIVTLQTQQTNVRPEFYYKSLISILSHSIIQAIYPTTALVLIKLINKGNYIRISPDELHKIIIENSTKEEEKEFFIKLFTPQTNAIDILEYLNTIITFLISLNDQITTINTEFLYQYQQTIRQLTKYLISNIQEFSLTTSLPILLSRLTNTLKVQFKGEPVEGLQIMGLLESRLLDFDNLIVTGFNDLKIPGNKSVNSIIPYNLRRAYNLPTQEDSDAIQAYNFYRTLYHAKNIHLIYDSRTEGSQNEISRYYYQLKYLLKTPIKHYNYTTKINSQNSLTPINNPNTDTCLSIYNKDNTPKKLSASKLKHYITCPLRFYFSSIIGIQEPTKINELGDASLLGRIYHHTMELYYNRYNFPEQITKEQIENLVIEGFKKESTEQKKQINITGFNKLTFNIICRFIADTIRFDIKRYKKEPFKNVRSEVELTTEIEGFNFIAYIDRIDDTKNAINIIDYKTTSHSTNDKINITQLFTSHESAYHEIFQILLYCYIYKLTHPENGLPIVPYLYKIYDFNKSKAELSPIKLLVPMDVNDPNSPTEQKIITDYNQISSQFETLLHQTLRNIQNKEIPFEPNPNDIKNDACKYCNFRTLCNKKDKPK